MLYRIFLDETESIMMSLFLDFLMKDAVNNPSKLVPYTKEMSDEMDDLLADVILDERKEIKKIVIKFLQKKLRMVSFLKV